MEAATTGDAPRARARVGAGACACAREIMAELRAVGADGGELIVEEIEGDDGLFFRPSDKRQSYLDTAAFKRVEFILMKHASMGLEVTNEGSFYGKERIGVVKV